MSFVLYDLAFLALFTLVVALFLYRRRDNLKREGMLYLYRTKVGLKIIEYTSTHFSGLLRPLQYVVVASGYILMVSMVWFLAKFTYIYTISEPLVKATKIPPIVPLVPYLPEIFKVDFLPPFYFTYWIIIIAIIAVSHEFAHGIFARLNNVKVKSTGFGFFGPFLAAFVEPDDKQMQKKGTFVQLSVLAAGTFANILMTILFSLIFWLFFVSSFTPAGVQFNTYSMSQIPLEGIQFFDGVPLSQLNQTQLNDSYVKLSIDGKNYFAVGSLLSLAFTQKQEQIMVYDDSPAFKAKLTGPITNINGKPIISLEELKSAIQASDMRQNITVTSLENGAPKETSLALELREGKPYLGVGVALPSKKGLSGWVYTIITKIRDPSVYYRPLVNADFAWFVYNLLWWIILINFSVALVNMLPLGFFDGGRFFYLTVRKITRSDSIAHKAFTVSTWVIFLIAIWLTARWIIALF